PPLLIVSAQAFISRAHANWAAAAYPAATILVVAWALQAKRRGWLKAAAGLHAVAFAALTIAVSNFSLIDQLGFADAVKRVRGWEAHGAAVVSAADGYDAIMADDRELIGGLAYYARAAKKPIAAWNSNRRVDHHFEAFHPYKPGSYNRVLYVTEHPDALALTGQFDTIRKIDALFPRHSGRTLYLFEASDYRDLRDDLRAAEPTP
ncbi:MAG: hypothetical protein AAGJ87_13215, partial [Pseudomonadota bacterium]